LALSRRDFLPQSLALLALLVLLLYLALPGPAEGKPADAHLVSLLSKLSDPSSER
jgi:hypothetical protein